MWRIFQLNKHLTKDGHVWNKFGSGNKESLSKAGRELRSKGKLNGFARMNGSLTPSVLSTNTSTNASPISSGFPSRIPSPAPSVASAASETDADGGAVGRETRRRLVKWWTKEYCAGRMSLCVIGKGKSAQTFGRTFDLFLMISTESLDELSNLVASLFSPIQNRGQDPLPMINDHPFGHNETKVHNSLSLSNSLFLSNKNSPLAFVFSGSFPFRPSCHSTPSKYRSLSHTNLLCGAINPETSLRTL